MFRRMPLCLALAVSLVWSGAGLAQTVYRCGESYSQQPCPGGKPVEADDPRSESQRKQTQQATQRDAKAAAAMEKSRLKEEAKPAQAIIPPPKTNEAQQARKAASGAAARKPAHFTAVSPASKDKNPSAKKKVKEKTKPDGA